VSSFLESVKPRSIVYLFSGGKDSSAALILTRDVVREYALKNNAKVYIVYIYITGNTHPFNAYCASSIMLWHEKNYGFKPVFLAREKVFQEYVAKYGLEIGSGRWCYTEFKEKLIRDFERTIPRPVVEIDGMKPSDSKHRSEIITSEIQVIERANGFRYYSWHPLYNMRDEDVFEVVRKHQEFRCVVDIYERFGDSLNCVICPYKSREKILRYHFSDSNALEVIYPFMKLAIRSRNWLKRFEAPNTLEKFINNKNIGDVNV